MRMPIIVLAMIVAGIWSLHQHQMLTRRRVSRYALLLNALMVTMTVAAIATACVQSTLPGLNDGATTAVLLIVVSLLIQIPHLVFTHLKSKHFSVPETSQRPFDE